MKKTVIGPKSFGLLGLFLLSVWLLVPAATAQNVVFKTVNCDTPGIADFNSIQEALNSLSWNSAIELEVTGTCKEFVVIGSAVYARNSVYIHPPVNQRAAVTVPPPFTTGYVVNIAGAHGISIDRLDITGGSVGIHIMDSSEVDLYDVTVEGASSAGVLLAGNSIAYINACRIRNGGGTGVEVSIQGSNTVSMGLSTIEGNGRWGVNVSTNGALVMTGTNTIRNNGATATTTLHGGIHATRNSSIQIQSTPTRSTEITGNTGPGILAEVNSSVSLQGANITSNSEPGVVLKTHGVLELVSGNTIATNGLYSITCDSWSLATGDLTGIDPKLIDCKSGEVTTKK